MTRSIAEKMTVVERHQLSWPVPVLAIARDLGIRVLEVSGWPEDLSGQIKKDPMSSSGYAIFVNASHHINRQRFTMAHELAHFILHENLILDGVTEDGLYRSRLSGAIETQANKHAADMLMHWPLINRAVNNGFNTFDTLAVAVEDFKNSMAIRIGTHYEIDA